MQIVERRLRHRQGPLRTEDECVRARVSERALCGVFGEREWAHCKAEFENRPLPQVAQAQKKFESFPLSLVKVTLRFSL